MRNSIRLPQSAFVRRYGPIAVLLVFPLLLLWRALFAGEAFFWGTPLLQFVPWQRMAAAMWRDGHLPLWNPLLGCGAPLAANYQTAAFYPLNLLYLLLPAEVAASWTTALHLALAGWGMYRWGRAVGLDRFPAFIGALALEGCGFLVARAALFPSMVFTFPWLPVWLWRAEALIRRKQARDALCLGMALGLGLLAGHAQTAFYGGVLLTAYVLFRTLQNPSNNPKHETQKPKTETRNTKHIIHITLSLALGIGLAAVQLLPTAELMLSSQRSSGVDYDFAMTYSLWPWRLITFAAPDFLGNPGQGNYSGYPNYWEGAGYVGLLPLLLAAEAIFRRRGGGQEARTGLARFWTVGVLLSLLLALGKNTPVFPFLFRHVPGFGLFQAPARWLAITTVALAALAALGAQWWPVGHRGRRLGALGIVIGVSLLIGGLAAPRLIPGLPLAFGPATARLGGTLAITGVLMLLQRDTAWWRVAVGAFVVLDLLLFGWTLTPTVDRSLYDGRTESGIFLSGGSSGGLSAVPNPARVYWPTDPLRPDSEYGAEYRIKFNYLTFDNFGPRDAEHWWGMREALLPNAGVLDGIASANNFDPLLVGRHAAFLEALVQAPALLRVMGVTHVASDRAWPGGDLVHETESTALYRLPHALGRAWVVPAGRQVPPDEMLAALADPAFDPTAEVLLEQLAAAAPPLTNVEYQVTLQDSPNRVTIHVNLDAPGYLVLADTWYPGWQVTVNGETSDLLRANYAFRAVWLEAGAHTVRMVYRPISVLAGGTVTLLSLLLLTVGLVLAYRREARA